MLGLIFFSILLIRQFTQGHITSRWQRLTCPSPELMIKNIVMKWTFFLSLTHTCKESNFISFFSLFPASFLPFDIFTLFFLSSFSSVHFFLVIFHLISLWTQPWTIIWSFFNIFTDFLKFSPLYSKQAYQPPSYSARSIIYNYVLPISYAT